MTYRFRYKRFLLWRKYYVIGHRYEPTFDKMILYFPHGSVMEIPRWKDCELRLGTDWVAAVQKSMEAKTGQAIPVSPGGV